MKKTVMKSLVFAGIGLALMAGNASAITYTYQDNMINFPGYNVYSGDTIGTPVISSMSVTVDGSRILESIVIAMTERRVFDSLFINTAWDGTGAGWHAWDYMVRDNYSTPSAGSNMGGDYMAWDGYLAQDGVYGVTSGYTYTLVPTGTGDRENHPYGIKNDGHLALLTGSTAFITWDTVNSMLIYDFSALYASGFTPIALADSFSVAYAPWCANDVVGSPVPEPATMFLLGSGLVGLTGIARRRMKKG